MKRIVSILFVSFLVWNYIGFFAYFQLEKLSAQKSFKRKLKLSVPKEELRTFHFSLEQSSELIWHKANEFEYLGNMYDIVYSDTSSNGECEYVCISDVQETILFEKLGEYVAQDLNTSKHKPLNKLKANLEQPLIFDSRKLEVSELLDFNLNSKISKDYLFSIKSGTLSLNSPPPDLLSI